MFRHCTIAFAVAGCTVLITPKQQAPQPLAASPLRIRPHRLHEVMATGTGADVYRYKYTKDPKRA